jgi:hypothetical protein
MKKVISLFACIILYADCFDQMSADYAERSQGHTESSQVQLGLSIAVLAFGLILSISILYFLLKTGKGFGNITFKTIGIKLILTASLFLIVAGYSQDQITPVIGLLGTIAGFIFGSNLSPANFKKEEQD